MTILRTSTCALLLCAFVAGCSSDSSSPSETDGGSGGSGTGGKATGGGESPDAEAPDGAAGDAGTPDAGDGGDGGPAGNPAVPTLGAQIDRFGRPAINTALNHSFDANDTTKGAAKDLYNSALPATWSTFAPEFAKNLAILDGLDGQCGNQFLAAATVTASQYATLAGALSDDELYVNSAQSTCGVFLGVEAEAVGVLTAGLGKCGGRTLTDDVIDTSYSVLAAGVFTGVTDGIASDADGAQTATFPFLAPPTP